MAVRRPGFAVFGMSFLDVIGSAFGAILLVFLMVSVMCSARAIERSYVMLQLKLDVYDGTNAEPLQDIAVPCRAMVLAPASDKGTPENLERLLAECESFDLRQLASDARLGRIDGRLERLASEIIVSAATEDGAMVVMRGVRPRRFWVVMLFDRQLPKSVEKIKVRVASIDGDVSSTILKASHSSNNAIIDKQLSTYVGADGGIDRQHLAEAALVIPVTMDTSTKRRPQQ